MSKVLGYHPWNQNAEAGDIMVSSSGKAWRLYERRGGPTAKAGELCMKELKKAGMLAKIENDKLVWYSAEARER